MENSKDKKDNTCPCKECIGLVMCINKTHFNILQCDEFIFYLVEKYKEVLSNFGKCIITSSPLNKQFVIYYLHDETAIILEKPSNKHDKYLQYDRFFRIIPNPYKIVEDVLHNEI